MTAAEEPPKGVIKKALSPLNTGRPSLAVSNRTKHIVKKKKLQQSDPFSSFARSAQQQKPRQHWTRTSYFTLRQERLVAQAPPPQTAILRGVHIYFTGVRSHSQRRLETLVWKNGGTVHKHLSHSAVTHIVADNLCVSKAERYLSNIVSARANAANQPNLVRPQWLAQSVQHRRILPTWKFQLIQSIPNVRSINNYFSSASRSTSPSPNSPSPV